MIFIFRMRIPHTHIAQNVLTMCSELELTPGIFRINFMLYVSSGLWWIELLRKERKRRERAGKGI